MLVIIKTIILIFIFVYLAYIIESNILVTGEGEIVNFKDKTNVDYKKTINDNSFYRQLATLSFYIVLVLGICTIFLYHGTQTTTIFTVLGSAGLAVALSLQGTLTNIVYGIKMTYSKTVKVGDTVGLLLPNMPQTSIIKGKIINITLFSVIMSLEKTNEQLSISNSLFCSGTITNYSVVYQ